MCIRDRYWSLRINPGSMIARYWDAEMCIRDSNKGMFRIYFEAGQRAFSRYQRQHDTITALENSLSAGGDDLLQKYRSQQEKNSHARNKLHFLTKEVLHREAADLNSLLEAASGIIPPRRYSILSADDLAALCRDCLLYTSRCV